MIRKFSWVVHTCLVDGYMLTNFSQLVQRASSWGCITHRELTNHLVELDFVINHWMSSVHGRWFIK